jgi:phospholipid transport system substrate-binding protein
MRKLFTRQLFASVALMGMLTVAAQGVWAANIADAEALIKNTTDQMLAALKDNPSNVYDLVEEIILPNFSFEKMSKLVLKRSWNSATRDQKISFLKAFRQLLVRTYSTALVDAAGKVSRIDYDTQRSSSLKAVVYTKVYQTNQAAPIKADYAMYYNQKDGKWEAYNVTVGGVSLVTNYRNEFAGYLRTGGMDYLIQMVEQKKEQAVQ